MKPKECKSKPLPNPNDLWPFTRVDAKILERMHREYLKKSKQPVAEPAPF